MTAPLRVWTVTDGRAGIESQAVGLAEALERLSPVDIERKRIVWPRWLRRAPTPLMPAWPGLLKTGGTDIAPPWPDIWIGNGRASIPFSIGVRHWSDRQTFVVQLQDPLRPSRLFDLVAPPSHDRLEGLNVFSITGAPHRVTPERLIRERESFGKRLAGLPRPHVTVLIGGRSRAFDLSTARATLMASEIADAVRGCGGSLLLTFSRRTPKAAETILRERLSNLSGWLWDGAGENPYFAFLATADHILVTEDSANMPAEAAATGRPVHLLKMDGGQARKRRFHAELETLGIARPLGGTLESWTYPPLRETERLAAEVLRRMRPPA